MSRRSQTAHNPARDEPAPSAESQDISEQSTLGERVSEAGSAATQAVRDTGEAIADRVGAAGSAVVQKGSALANTAVERGRSLAMDLEAFTRRRPLSALAGALLTGLIVGLLRRKRS